MTQVGCVTPDGLVKVHQETEVCEVCDPHDPHARRWMTMPVAQRLAIALEYDLSDGFEYATE